jgi:hypothetical protein
MCCSAGWGRRREGIAPGRSFRAIHQNVMERRRRFHVWPAMRINAGQMFRALIRCFSFNPDLQSRKTRKSRLETIFTPCPLPVGERERDIKCR